MNIMLEVKRSAPVRTIITRPIGNTSAPAVRIRPGALSWYHGAVSVERRTAQLRFVSKRGVDGRKGVEIPEAEEGTCHGGVEEELVEAHVGFLGAYSAYELDGLLGREGIHSWMASERSLGDRRLPREIEKNGFESDAFKKE
jgi:hypothetical protein